VALQAGIVTGKRSIFYIICCCLFFSY